MIFSKECRLALDQLDGHWVHKFRIRMVLNVLCGVSIAACGYTLSQQPDFQSTTYREDHEVLLYLPYVSRLKISFV